MPLQLPGPPVGFGVVGVVPVAEEMVDCGEVVPAPVGVVALDVEEGDCTTVADVVVGEAMVLEALEVGDVDLLVVVGDDCTMVPDVVVGEVTALLVVWDVPVAVGVVLTCCPGAVG